ncbi:MAG: hypothetical protein WC734_06015 [Patescibacteria group bacterium]|jgi:hypothetical protein
MNDFLPDEYKVPTDSKYMRLQDGENKFRILSKPIIGWLDWDNKKPVRFHMNAKPEHSIDPAKAIKHFWAFVVWNYGASKVQIIEITQQTIQQAIQRLAEDKEWGAPFNYDIKVTRTGSGMNTEYAINPMPPRPVAEEIMAAYVPLTINLDALYEGKDPFTTTPF